MGNMPAGWYDDGHGALRWWDGEQWTTEAQALPQQGWAVAGAAGQVPRSGIRWLPSVLIGVASGVATAALILGVVLLGPWSGMLRGQAPSAQQSTPADDTGTPPADEKRSDKELAEAAGAVDAYGRAWWDNDCKAYFANTTEDFREQLALDDCATFYTASRDYREGNESFYAKELSKTPIGTAIEVSVVEYYTSYYDNDGNRQEYLSDYESPVDYLVVLVDGSWRVDASYEG